MNPNSCMSYSEAARRERHEEAGALEQLAADLRSQSADSISPEELEALAIFIRAGESFSEAMERLRAIQEKYHR